MYYVSGTALARSASQADISGESSSQYVQGGNWQVPEY